MTGETSFPRRKPAIFLHNLTTKFNQNNATLGEKASDVEDSKEIVSTSHFAPMTAR